MMTVVSFVGNLVLARLLSPVEFGDFTLAASTILLVYMLAGFGSQEAIVQYRGEDSEHIVATSFWVSILVGGVLSLVSVGLSVASRTFGWFDVTVSNLMLALAIVYFGGTWATTLGTLLQRDLNHRPIAVVFAIGKFLSFALAIVAAWRGAGVWALLVREAVEIAVKVVCLLYINRNIPRLHLDRQSLRWLADFGSRILVVRISEVAYGRIDNLVVERGFGSAMLGSYNMAYRLSQLGFQLTYQTIGSVMFSAFAAVQSSKERLLNGFERSTYWLVRASCFVCLLAYSAGETATVLLYGEQWRDAGQLLVWMVPFILFLPLYENNRYLLEGIGLITETIWASLVKVGLFLIGLLIFPRLWGLAGIVISVNLSLFVGWIVLSYFVDRHLSIKWRMLMLKPAVAFAVAFAAILLVSGEGEGDFGRILITTFTGLTVYLLSLLLLEYKLLRKEADTILNIASGR